MRFLRDNPLALLAVAVLGFGAWVVADLSRTPEPSPDHGGMAAAIVAPPQPGIVVETKETWQGGPGVVTHEQMPHLKPGMSRSEVEAMIGPPPSDLVTPVEEADGQMTYRATYLANFDAPTIRPTATRRLPPAPVVPKSVIALEFDASRPGHPLVRVQYPDPLF